MNASSKHSPDWFASQLAMWPAWSSNVPMRPGEERSPHAAAPLDEQFDDLRETWLASAAKWSEFAREASHDDLGNADKLREMFTPASWAGHGAEFFDAALRRVLEGPRYALLWDLDRTLLELQQLTLRRDTEIAAYQAMMQKAWNQAFERFAKAVGSAPEQIGKRTWRSLVDQWLAVANDTLIEVYRSEEFLDVQRRTLRSAADRHLQERRIAEAWCEAAHVPTRTEVDELQREVVELRRELRLLRRAARADADHRVAGSPPRRTSPARRARA